MHTFLTFVQANQRLRSAKDGGSEMEYDNVINTKLGLELHAGYLPRWFRIILARQTGGTTVQLSPKQVNILALWRANRIIERYL